MGLTKRKKESYLDLQERCPPGTINRVRRGWRRWKRVGAGDGGDEVEIWTRPCLYTRLPGLDLVFGQGFLGVPALDPSRRVT